MDELAAIANLDTFQTLLQNNRSDKKIKKPTKGGIVEKFDLAMKKSASDRVLNQHLPSKLRGTKPEKKTVCFPDFPFYLDRFFFVLYTYLGLYLFNFKIHIF